MSEVEDVEEHRGRVFLTRKWVEEGAYKTGRDIVDWAGEKLEELSLRDQSQSVLLKGEETRRKLLETVLEEEREKVVVLRLALEEEGMRLKELQGKLNEGSMVVEEKTCRACNFVVMEDLYPKLGVLIVVIRLRHDAFTCLIIGSERQSYIVYQTAEGALSGARSLLAETLTKESESLGVAIGKAAAQMEAAIEQHTSMVERDKSLISTVYEIRMRQADERRE